MSGQSQAIDADAMCSLPEGMLAYTAVLILPYSPTPSLS